jgi:RNA polymerase sigma-70 factor (ECF subfamily)
MAPYPYAIPAGVSRHCTEGGKTYKQGFSRRILVRPVNTKVKEMTPDAETVLRDAASRGDALAWRALFDSANESVTGYIRWRCGGRYDLADEAIQETWLTAAKSLARFDPVKGPFSGWLCGIAGNVILNRLRDWNQNAGRVQRLVEEVPSRNGVPDRDTALRVAGTLAELPERFERALRAKYLDGMSVGEMAQEWNETPKAVESLLTRARQAFRERYERGDA